MCFVFLAQSPQILARFVQFALQCLQVNLFAGLNRRLDSAGLPVRVANLSSIWTVHYTGPSRYNWMLQYYLRDEGLALSWVGTGRLIFSLNYTDADFAEISRRFVAAAEKMQQDGWWWSDASLTNKTIRRQILKEMIRSRFSR